MGPVVLFDKSAVQMLNPNEAVWFDHFFLTVITPIFYCETLADLAKNDARISAEHEVAVLARKTPQTHCAVHTLHRTICIGDLMGEHLPMDGRPVLPAPIPVSVDGRDHVVFEPAPEMEAFARWENEDFDAVERGFASRWREDLTRLTCGRGEREMERLGIELSGCSSFAAIVEVVRRFISTTDNQWVLLVAVFVFLQVPAWQAHTILNRWTALGRPPIPFFAPFVMHYLTVELSFYGATSKGIVSRDRASNQLDFAYLFYLPFCQVFTSQDKLHRMCAPALMRPDQEFLTGADLKAGLREMQGHYVSLPETEREKGLDAIAPWPPRIDALVPKIWDRHLPGWEAARNEGLKTPISDELRSKAVDDIRRIGEAVRTPAGRFPAQAEVRGMVVRRRVDARRGDWWQIPKALDDASADED